MWKYKDQFVFGHPYIFIHPFKQQAVKHLVDNIPAWVDYAIVFGSAIMPYCRHESDIDIALIGNLSGETNLDNLRIDNQSYDFLKYKSVNELKQKATTSRQNVEKDIYERGVVVFER
jgi:predicted nucleotidyltransferase